MINKEKAIEFLARMKEGDRRCNALIMFMSAMFMMSEDDVLNNIKRLAEE